MSRHIRILSVGSDPHLLATRSAVLTRAGFRVTTARSRQEAILLAGSQHFEAAMLGWSLSEETCRQLSHDLEMVSPHTRVLILPPPEEGGALLESDPKLLLAMVRCLLTDET